MPRASKKQRVQDFVKSRGWTRVGEAEWIVLRNAFSDVSESTLRRAGIPIAEPWSGIHQHTLEELGESLVAFSAVYAARPDLRRYCRQQVIAAKDRARFAARSDRVDEHKRRLKSEMAGWMLVWLDDPAMFSAWVEMRRKIVSNSYPKQVPPLV